MNKILRYIFFICGLLFVFVSTANVQAEDFVIVDGYLMAYNGTAANVTIPSTVTEIGDSVFYHNYTIQSVVIPASVKYIGTQSFEGCSNLRSVTIEGAEIIDPYAFADCRNLTTLSLPSTLKEIYATAFMYCSGLSTVSLPAGLDLISAFAFYGTGLSSVTIPANVSEIYDDAFPSNATLTVTQGSFGEQWAAANGYNTSVISTSVILPTFISLSQNNLNMFVNDGFKLRAVLTPANVTNKAVIWTSSDPDVVEVEKIFGGEIRATGAGTATITARAAGKNDVLAVCTVTVKDFTCPSGESQAILPSDLIEIKDSAFEGDNSFLEFTIPDGVETIGNRAFAYCRCLAYVYIPDSVTFIGEDAFGNDLGVTFVCESDNYGAVYARRNGINWRVK